MLRSSPEPQGSGVTKASRLWCRPNAIKENANVRKLIRTAGIAVGTSAVGLLLSAGPVLAQTGSGSGSGATTTSAAGATTTTAASTTLVVDDGTDVLPQTGGPEAALLIGAGGLLGAAVGARFLLRRRQPVG
jgi:LPXTG-motif cell wall-anchored protein